MTWIIPHPTATILLTLLTTEFADALGTSGITAADG